MLTIKNLKAERDEIGRQAKAMLANMGSQRWTSADQSKFDAHLDRIDSINQRIEVLDLADDGAESRRERRLSALDTFLRKSPKNMTPQEVQRVRNAMSTTTGTQGGYTVNTEVSSRLVDMLKGYGYVRAVAQQLTTVKGNSLQIPTSDGTTEVGELLTENVGGSSLDASFGAVSMPVYRFGSKVFTVPQELLQDSEIDIVGFIFQRARTRIGRKQNALFTNGTGTGQPMGLVTAASVGVTGTSGQALTVITDNLIDLVDSVDVAHHGQPAAQPDAADSKPGFMMNQEMRRIVSKLKDSTGRPIYMPAIGGERPMLLDFPLYLNNDMASPAASAKTIAFGDLAAYMVRDVLDVAIYRFEDSAFALNGQVGFLAVARAGGNLLDSGAIKLYQHSAT